MAQCPETLESTIHSLMFCFILTCYGLMEPFSPCTLASRFQNQIQCSKKKVYVDLHMCISIDTSGLKFQIKGVRQYFYSTPLHYETLHIVSPTLKRNVFKIIDKEMNCSSGLFCVLLEAEE